MGTWAQTPQAQAYTASLLRHPGQLSGLLIQAHVPGAPVPSAHHLPAPKSKASQRPTARCRLDLQMWLLGNRLLKSRKNRIS